MLFNYLSIYNGMVFVQVIIFITSLSLLSIKKNINWAFEPVMKGDVWLPNFHTSLWNLVNDSTLIFLDQSWYPKLWASFHFLSFQTNFNFIHFFLSFSVDLTNLQQKMSLLEIDMLPNENTDTISTTSSSSISRRSSLRRSSSISSSSSMCSDNLHRTNRRVITKPKKNTKSGAVNPTTENEIRKFYLNRKMAKLKSTLLETIFEDDDEEEDSCNADDVASQVKLIGNKKIKRCLSFAVGSHPTKTLVQKRRKRIQNVLGGKPKTKRISMDTFMKKLKAIQESNDKCGERKE